MSRHLLNVFLIVGLVAAFAMHRARAGSSAYEIAAILVILGAICAVVIFSHRRQGQ